MATRIALLRGISVGGKNSLPMQALRDNPSEMVLDSESLHVWFLSKRAGNPDILGMEAACEASEAFHLTDSALYRDAPRQLTGCVQAPVVVAELDFVTVRSLEVGGQYTRRVDGDVVDEAA